MLAKRFRAVKASENGGGGFYVENALSRRSEIPCRFCRERLPWRFARGEPTSNRSSRNATEGSLQKRAKAIKRHRHEPLHGRAQRGKRRSAIGQFVEHDERDRQPAPTRRITAQRLARVLIQQQH